MSIHYGVVGTGPVGRVFAGLLRQAGHRVTVLCHHTQTQQILRRRPVVVKGKLRAYAELDEVLLEAADFVRAQPDVVMVTAPKAWTPRTRSRPCKSTVRSLTPCSCPARTASAPRT